MSNAAESSFQVQAPQPRGKGHRRSGSDSSPTHQRQRVKQEVCDRVLRRLEEAGDESIPSPRLAEELQAHFSRLPTRYALDVNTERAEDVLMHKRLLEVATNPELRPAFHVRAVQVLPPVDEASEPSPEGSPEDSQAAFQTRNSRGLNLGAPSFGSSPNLEALALDHAKQSPLDEDKHSAPAATSLTSPRTSAAHQPMHEVTFSTTDKPKLLSQLSTVLADVGLNIREAHVFSTDDGYSLDVFVVDGWDTEECEELQAAIKAAIEKLEGKAGPALAQGPSSLPPPAAPPPPSTANRVQIPFDGTDDWEIDSSQLKLQNKVASGSFGDLYRGTYCGQDVAIKILKVERLNDSLQQEFAQEVFIMRKVRHKNVVQFIGACTKPPNLSIVTEFMSGGSVYEYLQKQKAAMKPATLLKIACDVAKGMDYLHQNHIIHRDLKAANLLMDENEVVKVADFGVARVQANTGVMTAETGTYRWMAPEVIEHRPYDHKADIFSYGIVLWELLTGKLPYADLTPLQAAVGVVQKGLRPTIPRGTNSRLAELMERCWHTNPTERPEFSEITKLMQEILREVESEGDADAKKSGKRSGFFSALKGKGR